jgi:hypothetical protein
MVEALHGSETSPETEERLGNVRPPAAGQPTPIRGGPRLPAGRRVTQRGRSPVRLHPLDYTPSTLTSLVRDYRAGKLTLFTDPGKPGRKSAPRKDAARDRVIALRREGLTIHEISSRLAAEGTPLNRTGVGQILTEEGFGRLLRHPEPEASINPTTTGRDTKLPRAKVIDFDRFAGTRDTAALHALGLSALLADFMIGWNVSSARTTSSWTSTRSTSASTSWRRWTQPSAAVTC